MRMNAESFGAERRAISIAGLRERLARLRWRLGFGGRLEADYRQRLVAEWRNPTRWAIWIGAAVFASYGIFDYLVFPQWLTGLWTVRFGLVLPFVLICSLILWRTHDERIFQCCLLAVVLAGGLGISAFNLIMQTHYHQGLVLVLLFGCVVLPMRFPYALTSVVVLLGVHFSLVPGAPDGSAPEILNLFDTFSASAFSLIANYMIENYRRRDYLRARLLEQMSQLDGLTEVATRRAFDERLARSWAQLAASSRPLALMFIDVDHFKALNDRVGHQAGDACLRCIADVLRTHTRKEGDFVGRYGGEEFTLLLPDVSADEARAIAERIREEIAGLDLGEHAGEALRVTASIGVLWLADPGSITWEEALKRSDAAMYRAKTGGRNRVVLERVSPFQLQQ